MAKPASELPTLRQLLARAHLRLILFAVALAAASLMVSGAMVIRSYAQRNLTLIANTVGYTVEPAIVFGDREAIREGMVSVAGVATVDRVEVRDPAGAVLAEWQQGGTELKSSVEGFANRMIWPSPARATVARSGTRIAEVRVYGASGGLLRYALAGTIIALACLALTVIATRLLARRLQREVIEPLEYVGAIAHAVRRERTFDQRVPASGIAEIDRLGQDFNALLAELQGWHAGLTAENARLAHQADHDALTGLGNRALFEKALGEAVAQAEREGASFALFCFDIAAFKGINQRFGEAAGDAVLVAVSGRLRESIRPVDRAFRIGGDEFAVLLAPSDNREQMTVEMSLVRAAMAQPVTSSDSRIEPVLIEIGYALYPDDGTGAAELLRQADSGGNSAVRPGSDTSLKGADHA